MVFAGIDMSLSKAGCAIVDSDGKSLFQDTFHRDGNKIVRVSEIMGCLLEVLHNFKPELVAVEEPAYGAVKYVSYDLGGSYMNCMVALYRNKFDSLIVNQTKLKVYATGTNKSDKELVKKYALTKGHVFPDGKVRKEFIYDMADALVLAEIAMIYYKMSDCKPVSFDREKQKDIFINSKGTGLLDLPSLCLKGAV